MSDVKIFVFTSSFFFLQKSRNIQNAFCKENKTEKIICIKKK